MGGIVGGYILTSIIVLTVLGVMTIAGFATGSVITKKKRAKIAPNKNENNVRKLLTKFSPENEKVQVAVQKLLQVQAKDSSAEIATEAKLKLFEMNNKKFKKFSKLKELDKSAIKKSTATKSDSSSELFEYVDSVTIDKEKNLSINFPSNSIKCSSQQIVADYELALKDAEKKNYVDREIFDGVYPMQLSVKDGSGNEVIHFSDISSERFYDFSQKLMAWLFVQAKNSNGREVYKITAFDSYKPKQTSRAYRVKTPEDFETQIKRMNAFVEKNFTKFHKPDNTVNYLDVADVYNFADKIRSNNFNKPDYRKDVKQSKYFNNALKEINSKFDVKNKRPYINVLVVAGEEKLSFITVNEKAKELVDPYLAALAFVLSYSQFKYYRKEFSPKIKIKTKRLNSAGVAIEDFTTNSLDNFKKLFSENKSNPIFIEAVSQIAKERDVDVDLTKIEEIDLKELTKE